MKKGSEKFEKNEKNKKYESAKKVLTVIVILTVFVAAVFRLKSIMTNRKECKAIIDDYAKIILLQDEDSDAFDRALLTIGVYVVLDATAEYKEAAVTRIENTIAQFETDSENCVPYEADEAFKQMLEKHGISYAEYQMNAESRYTYLQDYIHDLEFWREYLAYVVDDRDVQAVYSFMTEEQRLMRAYNYMGINYWFAGWGDAEVDYVKQEVLDKLQSFSVQDSIGVAQDIQWKNSREAVETTMNSYLDKLETLYNRWGSIIGESWDELKDLRE